MTPDVADAFEPGEWAFTPEVVEEFDKHVRQSVPYYDTIQDTVAELADWLAPDGAKIVDVGCSTGETLSRIVDRHSARLYQLVGYDTSAHMLDAANTKLDDALLCFERDVRRGFCHDNAHLTLMLFTLQFMPLADRELVLKCAHVATAKEGGALLVAEKVRIADSRWYEIGNELLWDYKATQGIHSDAIRSKAAALRGVLIPASVDDTLATMRAAGWVNPTVLFRWHQWCLFGAFSR